MRRTRKTKNWRANATTSFLFFNNDARRKPEALAFL
jgi:hypothetical protein